MLSLSSSPDLILEASLLSIVVRKRAVGVETRVELALCSDMRKLALGVCTASTVSAERHRWVLEGALGVLAVGEELAVLLALMCETSGRRRVSCDTFAVLACGSEAAVIVHVDRSSGRGGR